MKTTAATAMAANSSQINSGLTGGRLRGDCGTGGVLALLAAVIVTVVVPDVFTGEFGTLQVTFGRELATEQVNVTFPVKLLCGVTVTVAVPELPG